MTSTRASVLDLGSNSFHVLVADVGDDGSVVPVQRQREMLHLGRAVAANDGRVPAELGARAVRVVGQLTSLARRAGATEHHAVATSALREAENGPELLARMSSVAGAPVRRLAGVEEARLSYLGVRAATGVDGAGVLVMDLGGGSLELAVGRHRTPDVVVTAPLGGSRLSHLVSQDPPSKRDLKRLRATVDGELDALMDELPTPVPDRVVLVGGTVRALARTLAAQDHDWLPATLNRLPISARRLSRLRDELLGLDVGGRADLPGMKSRRADHVHVAAVVVSAVLDRLGAEHAEVCDWGLREGVLLDAAGADGASPDVVRAREVARLRAAFLPDEPPTAHATVLALRLFDDLADLHDLGAADRELLACSSQLRNIGEALALRRHHHHGAYLVEHAEMRGFTPEQLAIVVTLVRHHQSRDIGRRWVPAAALSPSRRHEVRTLLALLRLADALDLARDHGVHDVTVERADGSGVVLRVHGEPAAVVEDDLQRSAALFTEVLGAPVELTRAGGAA